MSNRLNRKKRVTNLDFSEILDANGKIRPSDRACREIEKHYSEPPFDDRDAVERFRLAQAKTLIDFYFADKS